MLIWSLSKNVTRVSTNASWAWWWMPTVISVRWKSKVKMFEKAKRSSIERIDSGKSPRSPLSLFFESLSSSLIDCHDVTLGEYLRNAEHTESLRQRFASVPEINKSLSERNTALQVKIDKKCFSSMLDFFLGSGVGTSRAIQWDLSGLQHSSVFPSEGRYHSLLSSLDRIGTNQWNETILWETSKAVSLSLIVSTVFCSSREKLFPWSGVEISTPMSVHWPFNLSSPVLCQSTQPIAPTTKVKSSLLSNALQRSLSSRLRDVDQRFSLSKPGGVQYLFGVCLHALQARFSRCDRSYLFREQEISIRTFDPDANSWGSDRIPGHTVSSYSQWSSSCGARSANDWINVVSLSRSPLIIKRLWPKELSALTSSVLYAWLPLPIQIAVNNDDGFFFFFFFFHLIFTSLGFLCRHNDEQTSRRLRSFLSVGQLIGSFRTKESCCKRKSRLIRSMPVWKTNRLWRRKSARWLSSISPRTEKFNRVGVRTTRLRRSPRHRLFFSDRWQTGFDLRRQTEGRNERASDDYGWRCRLRATRSRQSQCPCSMFEFVSAVDGFFLLSSCSPKANWRWKGTWCWRRSSLHSSKINRNYNWQCQRVCFNWRLSFVIHSLLSILDQQWAEQVIEHLCICQRFPRVERNGLNFIPTKAWN